jgi:predicted DNA-binding helix-hairpin-helix protein
MEDLGRLRIALDRALPFIVVDDHSPRGLPDALDLRERITDRTQLDLFAVGRSAHSGEL